MIFVVECCFCRMTMTTDNNSKWIVNLVRLFVFMLFMAATVVHVTADDGPDEELVYMRARRANCMKVCTPSG